MGIALRVEYSLLHGRLSGYPWLFAVVTDHYFHAAQGRFDCGSLHAHDVGATGIDVRHYDTSDFIANFHRYCSA